jgi:hypothetical protein
MKRSHHILIAAIVGSLSAAAHGTITLTEHFDNDPTGRGWAGVNNRPGPGNPNNYGFSSTDNTGNSVLPPGGGSASGAGEIGGAINRAPNSYYGVDLGGAVDFATTDMNMKGVIFLQNRGSSTTLLLGWGLGNSTVNPPSGDSPAGFLGMAWDDGFNGNYDHGMTARSATGEIANGPGPSLPSSSPTPLPFEMDWKFATRTFTMNINGASGSISISAGNMSSLPALTHWQMFGRINSTPDNANTVWFDDLTYTAISLPGPATGVWNNPAGGDWNNGANWDVGGVQSVPNAVGAAAHFLSSITQSRTIYADQPVTVGSMKFDNANSYLITGVASLTLQQTGLGSSTIEVLSGTHKLNIPVFVNSNTNVTVSAGATLKVSDPVTVAAGKTITQSGNVVFESTVTMLPGSAIALGATLNGAHTLSINNLDMASDAKVDVSNNAVLVGSGSAASMSESVRSAFNGGAWNGSGITSSAAAADASHRTGVGIADSDDGVLLKYTYFGDANLNGTVDSGDFAALAAHFNGSGLWNQGDFNYDGIINALDFGALATNFGQAGAGSLGASALGSLIPEPGALALAATSLLLTGRRPRWRK